jgi:hypothetical protein
MSTEAVASVASMIVTTLMTLSASLLTTSTTSLLTKNLQVKAANNVLINPS